MQIRGSGLSEVTLPKDNANTTSWVTIEKIVSSYFLATFLATSQRLPSFPFVSARFA